jgi:uncharacterized membrane protein
LEDIIFYTGIGLIVFYVVTTLVLLIVIQALRSEIQEKTKTKSNLVGGSHGGTWTIQPLFQYGNRFKGVDAEVRQHDKAIKYFWLNLLTLMIGIIVVNLS